MKVFDSLSTNSNLSCFSRVIDELKSDLSGLPPIGPNFGKSLTIRKKMNELAKRNKWYKKVGINSQITDSERRSNFFVEYMHDFVCSTCDETHRINLELCFDNRQAMAANIFKLEIANTNFATKRNSKSLGVIVCLTDRAKQLGNWDNSVGTFDEYILAIETGYKDYIQTDLALISIDA
jgi:hypothetical protein